MKLKRIISFIFLLSCFLMYHKGNAQTPGWLWAKAAGGTMLDVCQSVAVDYGSKDLYATGWFQGTADFDPGAGVFNLTAAAGTDIFISKSDSAGNFIWAKAIGGSIDDYSYSIAIDPVSKDVYTTGYFGGTVDFDPGPGTFNLTSSGGIAAFIFKSDSAGNFEWAKSIDGFCWGNSIATDPAGNGCVYITGIFYLTIDFDPGAGIYNLTSAGNSGYDVFILKLNSTGNFMWARAMGGYTPFSTSFDIGNSIAVDHYGNVYTTGYFQGTSDFNPDSLVTFNLATAGEDDVFVSKLDSAGNFAWAKSIGGTGNDFGYSVVIDNAGNGDICITGYFSDTADFNPDSTAAYNLISAGGTDIFIARLDSSGKLVWAKAMGGTSDDAGISIIADPGGSGGSYCTGYFSGTADLDPDSSGNFTITSAGAYDIFISRLSGPGNFVWTKTMGGTSYDAGCSLAGDGSGNIYLGGYFQSPFISFDTIILTNNSLNNFSDIFLARLGSVPTGIENITYSNGISVFPNPASGELFISHAGFEMKKIKLYDALGHQVFSHQETGKSSQQTIIDVCALNTGVYFLQIQTADFIWMRKVIVGK